VTREPQTDGGSVGPGALGGDGAVAWWPGFAVEAGPLVGGGVGPGAVVGVVGGTPAAVRR
jgi:hypothetical protein